MNFQAIITDAPVAAAIVLNRTDDSFTQSQGDVQAYSQHIVIKDAVGGRRAEFRATKDTDGKVYITCSLQKHGGEFAHYSEIWKHTKFMSWQNVADAQKYFNAKSKAFKAFEA